MLCQFRVEARQEFDTIGVVPSATEFSFSLSRQTARWLVPSALPEDRKMAVRQTDEMFFSKIQFPLISPKNESRLTRERI
jgi:hypothetical protein